MFYAPADVVKTVRHGIIVFNYQPLDADIFCRANDLGDIAVALAESLGSVAYSVLDMELSYPVAVFT